MSTVSKGHETPGTMRADVFSAIFESPNGLTDEEVAALVNLDVPTVQARRRELVESGAVKEGDNPKQVGERAVPVWILARDRGGRHTPLPVVPGVEVRVDPTMAAGEARLEGPPGTDPVTAVNIGTKRPFVMLVDGKNILHRAYYGGKTSSVKKVHSLFTGRVEELVAMYQPAAVIVAYDPQVTWRHRAYPDYKGKRSEKAEALKKAEQPEPVRELCEAKGWHFVMAEGYEADDVIATYAIRLHHGHDVLIVSSDKDLYQLLRFPGVTQLAHNAGQDIAEVGDVEKQFGVRPEQIPDLLAIEGDKVDNIPGIKGVGRKGAIRALALFGDVEGCIAAAKSGKDQAAKRATQIVAQEEELRLFKRLTTLDNINDRALCPDIEIGSAIVAQTEATINEHYQPPGMVRLDGVLEPLPGVAHMAGQHGWVWTNPKDLPTEERRSHPKREGEPEERWERLDNWGFMFWREVQQTDEDEQVGQWFHRHRGLDVDIATNTDDVGTALPFWNDPHATFKAEHPASPDQWSEDWKTRETSVAPPPEARRNALPRAPSVTRIPPKDPDVTPADTRREAHEASEANAPKMKERVLAHITQCGPEGCTDEELDIAMGTEQSRTSRPNRLALVKAGQVERSGRTRKTKSGKRAVVWVLASQPTTEPNADPPLGDNEGNARDPHEEQTRRNAQRPPTPKEPPARTELWASPVGDNQTGYARVCAAWALEALTGTPMRLIWTVDLRADLGRPDDVTDANSYNDQRWQDLRNRLKGGIVAHETDRAATTAIGLVVSSLNPTPHEGGPPPASVTKRFALDVADPRVNIARMAHGNPPVGRWVFMSDADYAAYGVEEQEGFFCSLPF